MEDQTVVYTIEYVYGSYSGTYNAYLSSSDERDPRDVMWAHFRREGYLTLGMATRSAKIVETRYLSNVN